jgi:hypothetical protein
MRSVKKSEDEKELNKIHLVVTTVSCKRHVFYNQDECLGLSENMKIGEWVFIFI